MFTKPPLSTTQLMQQAYELSVKARFHAPPNPWVGCIIARDGQIIAEGFTGSPGQPHAEIAALQKVQGSANGADLFVTLEPCAHHGRTPPCVKSIIEAGIKRVFIGIEDPDTRVCGKGIELLRAAGTEVYLGLYKNEITESLKSYLHQRVNQLPYTVLKTAMSIDGKSAAADGSSQWISCSKARVDGHKQRAYAQAIVVGANTALHDKPNLTVRHPDHPHINQPLRVLIDSKGKVPAIGPLFNLNLAPTLVITTASTKQNRIDEWKAKGADVEIVQTCNDQVDLQQSWQLLAKRQILQILVEGGSSLQSSLIRKGLVNEWICYIGPLLIGNQGLPIFTHPATTLKESKKLFLRDILQIDQTIRVTYSLTH